ncbi:MAG: oxaloacetate decarboxylase [Burkholderiales bacterium]|jgi:methylisocitrate lyase|nr:oxaloacetate decarboxylase [Burkholderiales bacterium]
MSKPSMSAQLRQLIQQQGLLRMPCVYDGITARLGQEAGFPALATSGNAVAASLLGVPDLGLLGLAENVQHAARLVNVLHVPLICDADTGYGGILNSVRTLREFEAAGVAGIYLEDQVFPKKCGQLPSDTAVESMADQCRKIEALAKAKVSSDFYLIARTDAKSVNGLDDAAQRGKQYLEAGADAVLVVGADTAEELERVAEVVRGPLMTVLHEHPPSGDLDDAFLRSVGCVIAIHSGVLRYAVVKKLREVLATMRQDGSTRALRHEMCNLEEYNKVLGIDDWLSLES